MPKTNPLKDALLAGAGPQPRAEGLGLPAPPHNRSINDEVLRILRFLGEAVVVPLRKADTRRHHIGTWRVSLEPPDTVAVVCRTPNEAENERQNLLCKESDQRFHHFGCGDLPLASSHPASARRATATVLHALDAYSAKEPPKPIHEVFRGLCIRVQVSS